MDEARELLRDLLATEPAYGDESGAHCTYCDGQWLQTVTGGVEVAHTAKCPWMAARIALPEIDRRSSARDLEAEVEAELVAAVMEDRQLLARAELDGLLSIVDRLLIVRETLQRVGLRDPEEDS